MNQASVFESVDLLSLNRSVFQDVAGARFTRPTDGADSEFARLRRFEARLAVMPESQVGRWRVSRLWRRLND
jgi:hypothetical protein